MERVEHFDVLSVDMRMENENKIKVKYNVQSVEIKFHHDLREHMDALKVKIEMLDTKRYMEKIKWSQMEVGYRRNCYQLRVENNLAQTG